MTKREMLTRKERQESEATQQVTWSGQESRESLQQTTVSEA